MQNSDNHGWQVNRHAVSAGRGGAFNRLQVAQTDGKPQAVVAPDNWLCGGSSYQLLFFVSTKLPVSSSEAHHY